MASCGKPQVQFPAIYKLALVLSGGRLLASIKSGFKFTACQTCELSDSTATSEGYFALMRVGNKLGNCSLKNIESREQTHFPNSLDRLFERNKVSPNYNRPPKPTKWKVALRAEDPKTNETVLFERGYEILSD